VSGSAIPLVTMSTFRVEVAGEFLIEADDLEGIMDVLEAHVASQGLIVYVDPVNQGDDEDDEPTCIEDLNLNEYTIAWNPYSEFATGRN
jgi:hypothetical protein